MTTTQGQRQEKTQLVARVEKYKLEEEMAVLSSSVWMAMLYCLRKKGEYRMILWQGNGGGMVEPWQCEEMQKTNVEQTKICAYGKQLELKSGLKCSIMRALWTCSLELSTVEL